MARKSKIVNLGLFSVCFYLGCNSFALVLGIIYLSGVAFLIASILLDFVIPVTYIGNIVFILCLGNHVYGKWEEWRRVNVFFYYYLGFFALFEILGIFGNFMLSASLPGWGVDFYLSYTFVFLGFFGPCLMGLAIGISLLKRETGNPRREAEHLTGRINREKHERVMKLQKIRIYVVTLVIICIAGPLLVYVIFTKPDLELGFWMGVFVAQLAGFLGFAYVALAAIMVKIGRNFISFKMLTTGATIASLVVAGVCFVPLLSTPAMVNDAETSFTGAFGSEWRSRLDPAELACMKPSPFNLAGYFLNQDITGYKVTRDVLYYNGTSGVDAGVQLYFDVYMPARELVNAPGKNATFIRIHGGGWQIGDKARGNMVIMNKYFASQGYIVFDVQHGMNDAGSWQMPLITPEHVLGNFTTDDMVRHLGIFAQFLTAHYAEYGCNLSRTFISGGSAGGHLTCAMAFAIASGNYTTWFGTGITVKGIVPFYPGNGLAQPPMNGNIHELWDPTVMVGTTSPPCLIFQGTNDIVHIVNATRRLQQAYDHAGVACATIWAPFAGHGNDIHFTGHYNQVFLYYMERFMALQSV
nr:carboxylesterase family protein [Candidatus Sigynarchaeota archaeon]